MVRRHRIVVFLASAAVLPGWLAAGTPGRAAAQTTSPSTFVRTADARHDGWGNAREVPGTAALNVGGDAAVSSISCTSPGNCAAGGYFGNDALSPGASTAFVVSERGGRWTRALALPGASRLSSTGSEIGTVSCSADGNCTAGGSYADSSGQSQAMLITERHGRWAMAFEVPGTAALNGGGDAQVSSVSCASAGNCAADGFYLTGTGTDAQPFVASEVGGRWRPAQSVRGMDRLNTGRHARASSVSCSSAGDCAAGGFYTARGRRQAFVATERSGRWGTAIEVPGTATMNVGGDANVDSVSCPSPGNCGASGYYKASVYNGTTAKWQAFAVSERNGQWSRAVPLLRAAAVFDNVPGAAGESVSCTSAGSCAVGGAYGNRSLSIQAFVASQRRGRWSKAVEVPGTAALNHGHAAEVFSVSCVSAGNCSAGGYYTWGGRQAFVVSERDGIWMRAMKVPGTTVLNAGRQAAITAISCTAPRQCSAGGYYTDHGGAAQAFVLRRT